MGRTIQQAAIRPNLDYSASTQTLLRHRWFLNPGLVVREGLPEFLLAKINLGFSAL